MTFVRRDESDPNALEQVCNPQAKLMVTKVSVAKLCIRRDSRCAIDVFFLTPFIQTFACNVGNRAVGVILSSPENFSGVWTDSGQGVRCTHSDESIIVIE